MNGALSDLLQGVVEENEDLAAGDDVLEDGKYLRTDPTRSCPFEPRKRFFDRQGMTECARRRQRVQGVGGAKDPST